MCVSGDHRGPADGSKDHPGASDQIDLRSLELLQVSLKRFKSSFKPVGP